MVAISQKALAEIFARQARENPFHRMCAMDVGFGPNSQPSFCEITQEGLIHMVASISASDESVISDVKIKPRAWKVETPASEQVINVEATVVSKEIVKL